MTVTLKQMKELIALCDKIGISYDYYPLYRFGEEKICGHSLNILDNFETLEIDEEDKKYNNEEED